MNVSKWLAPCLFSVFLGCGGSLKYHVDDALLADVPVGEKQSVLAAQSEMDQAAEETRKAGSDISRAEHDVSVAEAEYAESKAEVAKAEADLTFAQQGKDMNTIQPAKARLELAKQAKGVADLKVDLMKQRLRQVKAVRDAADAHAAAAGARRELEKARLAQQKGKSPGKDFNVANFDGQASEKQRRFDEARVYADKQQLAAAQLEQKYNQKLSEYNARRGTVMPTAPQPGAAPAASPVAPPPPT